MTSVSFWKPTQTYPRYEPWKKLSWSSQERPVRVSQLKTLKMPSWLNMVPLTALTVPYVPFHRASPAKRCREKLNCSEWNDMDWPEWDSSTGSKNRKLLSPVLSGTDQLKCRRNKNWMERKTIKAEACWAKQTGTQKDLCEKTSKSGVNWRGECWDQMSLETGMD